MEELGITLDDLQKITENFKKVINKKIIFKPEMDRQHTMKR